MSILSKAYYCVWDCMWDAVLSYGNKCVGDLYDVLLFARRNDWTMVERFHQTAMHKYPTPRLLQLGIWKKKKWMWIIIYSYECYEFQGCSLDYNITVQDSIIRPATMIRAVMRSGVILEALMPYTADQITIFLMKQIIHLDNSMVVSAG